MRMDPAVYQLFDRAAPVIIVWLMGFLALSLTVIARNAIQGRTARHRDSMIGGELPGILLVLMHSVCFVYSCVRHDWLSAVIFGWWGPGFVVVAILVLAKRPVPWKTIARTTSIACKLNYLVLVGLFLHYRCLAPVYAYSLWIMHDQVRLAWLQGNADRSRRLLEDTWLPRLCYPAFLVLPFISPTFPLRWWCAGVAVVVWTMWIAGLMRLVRQGRFRTRPESYTANLRDIVYLTLPPVFDHST